MKQTTAEIIAACKLDEDLCDNCAYNAECDDSCAGCEACGGYDRIAYVGRKKIETVMEEQGV